MDPQSSDLTVQLIVASINEKLSKWQLTPHSGPYSICRFPDFLVGIDDGIRSPRLASFGPCHRGKKRLLPFESHKCHLYSKFISRTNHLGRDERFYVAELERLKDQIKGCYSPKIAIPSDVELLAMMLLDGCFIVELFRQYDEDKNKIPPWSTQTLIADLLKLENQLPFFFLEELYRWSNVGQNPSISTLPDLAMRYLSQAFRKSPDTVKSVVQDPEHLLDLFRRNLLPPNQVANGSNQHPPIHPIQSVKQLRSVGITMRQKAANSLLEIDFSKFQIPPLALKIPPFAIDDFANSVLVNCVALEQCLPDQTTHFTAYVCFMSCLVKQPEDVGYLRLADIIDGSSQDEMSFIKMVNSIGIHVHSSLRESYLWKQLREIHCYYNSCWALFRRFFEYNKSMLGIALLSLVFALLSFLIAIFAWRIPVK